LASTIDQVIQEFQELKSFVTDKVDAGTEPLREETERLAKAFEQLEADLKEIRRAKIANMGQDGKLIVRDGRLAGYDALDLAMLRNIMNAHFSIDPELARTWVSSTRIGEDIQNGRKAISDYGMDALLGWQERSVHERQIAYGASEYNPSLRKFREDLAAWGEQMMMVKRKAMDSTTAGRGDELVSTIEAAQLWMDVNLDTVVLPVMTQIPMPSNPYTRPRQLGDVNWYPAEENVQVTTSDPSTGLTTITAFGLRAGVPFSDELEEDAIIALVPELRRSLARNAAEVIDDVLLNGDTTVTNGINSDGATISKQTAGKAHWLLGFDGLIHLPIVDNTGQANQHNAAVSADMFNEILSKLGKYAAPSRNGDVVFISDVNTAIRSLSIDEFETADKAGPTRMTLSSGEILNVYGKPYIHTSQMRLADTDGKVTDAGNSANTGRLLVFNTTQWAVGFRRQITMEADREPGKGQTTLYISFRIALQERSGTRSTATHTAAQYQITGVA
jgi:HK97 family phage major capsid protein